VSLEGRFMMTELFDATLIGPEQDGYNVTCRTASTPTIVASACT